MGAIHVSAALRWFFKVSRILANSHSRWPLHGQLATSMRSQIGQFGQGRSAYVRTGHHGWRIKRGRRLRGASVRGREAHRDVETPAGLGPGGEGRVVGGGDGLDDGQAKTEAVRLLRGIGAEPLEGLEEPVAAAWASASWPSKATSTAMPTRRKTVATVVASLRWSSTPTLIGGAVGLLPALRSARPSAASPGSPSTQRRWEPGAQVCEAAGVVDSGDRVLNDSSCYCTYLDSPFSIPATLAGGRPGGPPLVVPEARRPALRPRGASCRRRAD